MFDFDDVASVQAGIDLAVTENRSVIMKFTGSANDVLKEIIDGKETAISQFDDDTSLYIRPHSLYRTCAQEEEHKKIVCPEENHQSR